MRRRTKSRSGTRARSNSARSDTSDKQVNEDIAIQQPTSNDTVGATSLPVVTEDKHNRSQSEGALSKERKDTITAPFIKPPFNRQKTGMQMSKILARKTTFEAFNKKRGEGIMSDDDVELADELEITPDTPEERRRELRFNNQNSMPRIELTNVTRVKKRILAMSQEDLPIDGLLRAHFKGTFNT